MTPEYENSLARDKDIALPIVYAPNLRNNMTACRHMHRLPGGSSLSIDKRLSIVAIAFECSTTVNNLTPLRYPLE